MADYQTDATAQAKIKLKSQELYLYYYGIYLHSSNNSKR